MDKTHWRKFDYRIKSLEYTIEALDKVIEKLQMKSKKVEWYDGDWLMEECEPIIGVAFVSFQNYINSSIYDRFKSHKNRYKSYKAADEFDDFGRTKIELIIGLANYFKHRDESAGLHKSTAEILEVFQLERSDSNKDIGIENSPILKGLEMLSDNWKLYEIIEVVKKWRDELWVR